MSYAKLSRYAAWLAHAFAFVSLGLVIAWAGGTDTDAGYLGGFNWTNHTFNYHPVMMVGGLLVAGAEAMLAYRFWPFGHFYNKVIHAVLQTTGLAMVVTGLNAVFLSHNSVAHGGIKPNLYTAHSWLGMFVVTLYFFQYVMGVATFCLRVAPETVKSAFLPLHKFLGKFIYSGALMAAGMGIAEKTGFNAAPATYAQPDVNPASHYNQLGSGYRIAFGIPIALLFTAFFAFLAVNDVPSAKSTEGVSEHDAASVEEGGDKSS
jgi:cytochrome b-561